MLKLSVDDGCAWDMRVADLATKYEIPLIFYWPTDWHSVALKNDYLPLSYSDAMWLASRFEVGSHGITHEHLTKMDYEDALYEIAESKVILENMFGVHITKFAPSRGYTNPQLTEFTMRLYDSQRLTKGKNLVHIHPNSGANDNVHWLNYYERLRDTEQEIELWGHSFDFDRYNLWDEIEGVLRESPHS